VGQGIRGGGERVITYAALKKVGSSGVTGSGATRGGGGATRRKHLKKEEVEKTSHDFLGIQIPKKITAVTDL